MTITPFISTGSRACTRRQNTRATDLDLDAQQLRGDFTRRELEGDGAARVLANEAQLGSQTQVVDLDDHAVGLVGQVIAAFVPSLGVGNGFFDIIEAAGCVGDREAKGFQVIEQVPLGARFLRGLMRLRVLRGMRSLRCLRSGLPGDDLIDKQGQRTGSGDGGVELAQGAGGGIARVKVGFFPGFFQFLVEFVELPGGDEDFTTNNKVIREPHSCPSPRPPPGVLPLRGRCREGRGYQRGEFSVGSI